MSTPATLAQGEVSLDVPDAGVPCKTWYRIHGDIHAQTPTVLLHGGPGGTHLFLEPIEQRLSTPTITYDQLGCGNSTHLLHKDQPEGASFWTVDLFIAELENLLEHLGVQEGYNVLGHSWGGMLAAAFAIRKPKGLKKLVLFSATPSLPLYNVGKFSEACRRVWTGIDSCRVGNASKRVAASSRSSPRSLGCRLDGT
ncbi:alpha beta-hydrolase [Coniophora puteana RWD-64-598 SS2]|uniref:Alpha beta-hydrolase n=1 Tax=Coniophora puteana (strain RWD-64-598) TaxID=741705 RepID=A0A5M3MGA7_CONPW|nr:alpha beta-hydrolase [Coniophora puteana RWD-64-598 SS2]EIW78279.1 alpha beta-hydrolase [Coniophora puteana RWD-64-598 SS2]